MALQIIIIILTSVGREVLKQAMSEKESTVRNFSSDKQKNIQMAGKWSIVMFRTYI